MAVKWLATPDLELTESILITLINIFPMFVIFDTLGLHLIVETNEIKWKKKQKKQALLKYFAKTRHILKDTMNLKCTMFKFQMLPSEFKYHEI